MWLYENPGFVCKTPSFFTKTYVFLWLPPWLRHAQGLLPKVASGEPARDSWFPSKGGLGDKKIPQLAGKILSIDGRNPKQPPGMYKTLKILGQTTYHLVHLRETRYIFKGGFQLNFFLDFCTPKIGEEYEPIFSDGSVQPPTGPALLRETNGLR